MIEFATKRDINGNVYHLNVFLELKQFDVGYFMQSNDPIIVTKKDIKKLAEKFRIEGFKDKSSKNIMEEL